MTLVAGVDIGNATTEIVIADEHGVPALADRMPTRGVKGSAASGAGAARLLGRMERTLGRRADVVVLTPQTPVSTISAELPPATVDTGRLRLLSAGASTPAGGGIGIGRPVDIRATPDGNDPIVLVARDPLGFRDTVDRVRGWRDAGHDVVAVLLAGDEAVLVASRLAADPAPLLPVADCIDPDAALACHRIVVEVAAPGEQVRQVTDPIRLVAALGLAEDEHVDATATSTLAQGARVGVVGVQSERRPATADRSSEASITIDGTTRPLRGARDVLASGDVGTPSTVRLPAGVHVAAADLWLVDLDEVARLPGLHPRSIARRTIVLSALAQQSGPDDHVAGFTQERTGPVLLLTSEAAAGRRGALTTPGVSATAVVIDLGGGTVDATGADSSGNGVSAAGSGTMMTTAVADALGISTGAAEWVKRGPASRVDAPHLAVRETGDREFLEPAAPSGTVGWLVAPGPGGPLPFTHDLELAQWRAVRQALKRAVFADNLARVLRTLDAPPGDVVLVGGPAGDDELLDVLNGVLPGVAAGRGNVAGTLGHRWSVAYGLVLAALDDGITNG